MCENFIIFFLHFNAEKCIVICNILHSTQNAQIIKFAIKIYKIQKNPSLVDFTGKTSETYRKSVD